MAKSNDLPAPTLQAAVSAFRQRFNAEPEVITVAPGRVNLIGEHVDYNNGFVLPMAIERYVVIAARPVPEPIATITSTSQSSEAQIHLGQPLTAANPNWANYPRGVLAGFQQRRIALPGFEAIVSADLPPGGGLSSSAALEVATCRLLENLTGTNLSDLDCIRLCQKAEHEFAGVPCGIMDQFIVTSARRNHALLLDCRSLDHKHIPLDGDEVGILITHSGVAHELGKGEYAKRRADCERAARHLGVSSLRSATMAQLEAAAPGLDELATRRARHVIAEIRRAPEFANCLKGNDWETAGRLMYDSHTSLRDDYEVSCRELDELVDIARSFGPDRGVFGSRLTGAGFGGCTVTLVKTSQADEVRIALVKAYHQRTGIQAQSFVSLPAAGARRV